MLRRAAARDPGDPLAGEQPEPGPVVLRHPKAADVLHTQLKLLRRLRHYAAGLLRRAAALAAPHAQQLGLQPHQRRLPQRIEQVSAYLSARISASTFRAIQTRGKFPGVYNGNSIRIRARSSEVQGDLETSCVSREVSFARDKSGGE